MKTQIVINLESHPATQSAEKLIAVVETMLSGLYGVRDYEVTSEVTES